jgi:hypothetical protein
MDKIKIFSWTLLTAIFITLFFLIIYTQEKNLTGYVAAYQDMAYKTERAFIENIPVYRDFATAGKISELVKFGLKDSAAEASKHGVVPLRNIEDINKNIKNGKLVPVDTPGDKLYYFHNVKKEYRYLSPQGKAGLELTAERFQEKIQTRQHGLWRLL